MYRQVLLDTGPLVALLNRRDSFHEWTKLQWKQIEPPLLTCEAVIAEACFLLQNVYGGQEAVMSLIETEVIQLSFNLKVEIQPIKALSTRWVKADQLCFQITDGEHNQPPYQSEGFPMLTATHVQDGYVDMTGAKFINQEAFNKARFRCAPINGDLLIVSVGATTGRAAIIKNCPDFAIVRSVLLLKPLTNVQFLLSWIRSILCQNWIKTASGASAQAHLYINDTKNMPIPFTCFATPVYSELIGVACLSACHSTEARVGF